MSPSKYGAVRTEVDGITFASKREATRYRELLLLQRAGLISDLLLQPVFDLEVAGEVIGKYIADFQYCLAPAPGTCVVEDAKGVRTALYKWKRKHVMAQYGIEIIEI